MFDFLIGIPGAILRFCNTVTGNYILALFLFAVIVEICMLPFSIKQQKNSIKQARLRPKEMAIRNKYKGRTDQATQQKCQNEIMEMYQRENFNPMSGCLPLLIQMPIIIALYNVVINPLKYICQLSDEAITAVNEAITKLPSYTDFVGRGSETIKQMGIIRDNFDYFKSLGIEGFAENIPSVDAIPNFLFFGGHLDLAQTPSFDSFNWLLAIPVLTFVFAFLSSKVIKKFSYQPTVSENDKSQGCSNAMMDFMMPLMSVYIAFIVPGAIGVYWMFKNIISMLEKIIIAKVMPIPVVSAEEMAAAEAEVAMSNRARKKQEKARSLHHIDDEDDGGAAVSRMEARYEDKPAELPPEGKAETPIAPAPLKEDDRKTKK